MKKYIGTKEVSATPAWRIYGKIYPKDGAVPCVMDREDGYKVVYEDGYESWSPKDVFEKSYRIAETHVDRMIIEQDELICKINALQRFIDTAIHHNLSDEKKVWLLSQRKAMLDYKIALGKRVKLEL